MKSCHAGFRLLPVLAWVLLAAATSVLAENGKSDCDPEDRSSWPACAVGNLCLCAADDVEYRRDKVLLNDVILYQGGSPLMVRAQHAETPSIDFSDSTWNLSGGVLARLPQGQLAATSATVHIKLGDLSAATFRGTPATFEESSAVSNSAGAAISNVRGSANTIDYDALGGGQIRLIEDVRLFDGCKDIRGAGFIYNLTQKNLKSLEPAAGALRERVHGTFQRGCKPQAPPSGAPAASAPATGPAQ
jgi:hypothetical protein